MSFNLGNNSSLNLGAGVSCFEVPQCIGLDVDTCGYTNVSQLMQGLGNAIANPCSPPSCSLEIPVQNGMQSIISSIASEFSNPCTPPSANIPCSLIGANYSASFHTTTQSIFSEISNLLQNDICSIVNNSNISINPQGALQCQPAIQFPGLSIFVGNFIDQALQTTISTVTDALNNTTCDLLNNSFSTSVAISGPLASCLNNATVNANIAQPIAALAKDLADSIQDSFNIAYGLNACDLLNGVSISAGGQLGNCGYSFNFGIPSLKGVLQDLIDQVANLINDVFTDPCATYQINLPCNLNSISVNGANLIDNALSSTCATTNVMRFIRDNACDVIDNVLNLTPDTQCVTAMITQWIRENDCVVVDDVLNNGNDPNCVTNIIKQWVTDNDCDVFDAVWSAGTGGGPSQCVETKIEDWVLNDFLEDANNRCAVFDKFIQSDGSTQDSCVKNAIVGFVKKNDNELIDSILNNGQNPTAVALTVGDYVRDHACDIIKKINEGTITTQYTNSCSSDYRKLVNSIISDYLNNFSLSPNFQPAVAMLAFMNEIVETIGKQIKICDDNGNTRTIKVLTTTEGSGLSINTKYYD